jgi:hypothetical protein
MAMQEFDNELDLLFQQYRDTCPDPEVSAGFMPGLWTKLEARRRRTFRLTHGLVAAAISTCLLLALALIIPQTQGASVYSATYIDVLVANDDDQLAYTEIQYELPGESFRQ